MDEHSALNITASTTRIRYQIYQDEHETEISRGDYERSFERPCHAQFDPIQGLELPRETVLIEANRASAAEAGDERSLLRTI